MQEINYSYNSDELNHLEDKISKAIDFCVTNNVFDLNYAKILLIFLKHNM